MLAARTLRIILSIALLVGVYSETGIWTTLSLALIGLSHELENYYRRKS
jgi:hypothetical protein